MKSKILLAALFFSGSVAHGQSEDIEEGVFLAQLGSAVQCGVKPIPRVGYRIGRCINGQWEQVSKGGSSGINCGVKPIPRVGYRIGRCVNGQWEQVSDGGSSGINCGVKPIPRVGYRIGRCVNGQWEQIAT